MPTLAQQLYDEFAQYLSPGRGLKGSVTQKEIANALHLSQSIVTRAFQMAWKVGGRLDGKEIQIVPQTCEKVLTGMRLHFKVSEGVLSRIHSVSTELQTRKLEKGIIAHPEFPDYEINKRVSGSEKTVVKIIDTYTSPIPTDRERHNEIRKWVRAGARLKLLVLDPVGVGLELRAKADLQITLHELRQVAYWGLRDLLDNAEKYPDQLEIKIFDENPAIHGLIFDDMLFYGFHLSFGHSQKTTFFEVQRNDHHVYRDINTHFDNIWNDANRSSRLTRNLLEVIETKVNWPWEKSWEGQWALYLENWEPGSNGRFTVSPSGLQAGSLIIEKQPKVAIGNLTLAGFSPLSTLVQIEKIGGTNYLNLTFSSPGQLHAKFTLHDQNISNGNIMFGTYQLNNGTQAYAGNVVLKKGAHDENGPLTLETFFKTDPFLAQIFAKNVVTHSIQPTNQMRREYDAAREQFPFAGVYKMYSYGKGQNEVRGIYINKLDIKPYGMVHFDSYEHPSSGWASYHKNNLYITTSDQKEPTRQNFLVLHTKSNEPQDGRIYAGLLLWISANDELPNARRVVLEYMPEGSEVKPAYCIRGTKAFDLVPETVQNILSGRVDNFIGFMEVGNIFTMADLSQEWRKSLDFKNVFLYAAVLYALREEDALAWDMLRRALHHGMNNLEEFADLLHWTNVDSKLSESQFKRILDKMRLKMQDFEKERIPSGT